MTIQHVRIEEAKLANAVIWDVRDPKSFRAGHLASAINHPLETLDDFIFDAALAEIDPATPIYVLCGGGTKASKAVAILEKKDPTRQYIELKGGTRAAKACGLPIMMTHTVYEPL